MNRATILTAVAEQAKNLKINGLALDGQKYLLATCGVESSFGKNCGLRTEPAYSPGGLYYKRSPEIQKAFGLYGYAACGSWGPWQIMYPTAAELGFGGLPWELYGAASLPWVIRLLNVRFLPHVEGPEAEIVKQLADAYNSGNSKDQAVPVPYINKVLGYYGRPLAELQAQFAENPQAPV